ncbi:hypothetical protein BKA56DRAFT_583328 [Ilyonectria sp. MPI-CAGE-AT-0026]|nr:hypothetical protein BKA56DRAFT_583328 [Ilyonectria sp. MPI-CAGE-AT-0026]
MDTHDSSIQLQSRSDTQLLDADAEERPRDRSSTSDADDNSHGVRNERPPRHARNVFGVWGFEIFMLLWSIALLLAIFFILMRHRRKELPNWGDTITINALVAVLATLLRISIAFVAAGITGQAKWDWISQRARPVKDMQIFDDASRGVIGSLKLIPLVCFKMPLILGAVFITVFSFAIGPFSQQAIQTYPCSQLSPEPATIVTVNREQAQKISMSDNHHLLAIDFGLRVAIQDALVNPSNDSNIGALFSCPTGNCEFPTYADKKDSPRDQFISHASLGICSGCFDVGELVVGPIANASANTTEFRLPIPLNAYENKNSTTITMYHDTFSTPLAIKSRNLSWAQNVTTIEMQNRARWAFASFSILAASQGSCKTVDHSLKCSKPQGYAAASFFLYPCIKYYKGSVKSGVLTEKVVRDVPLRLQRAREVLGASPGSDPDDWKGVQFPCAVNGTLYTSDNMSTAAAVLGPDAVATVLAHTEDWASQNLSQVTKYVNITAPLECIFELSGFSNRVLANYLYSEFESLCPRVGDVLECDPWYLAALAHNGTASFATVDEDITSLALRMTRELRLHGRGPHQDTAGAVKGDALRNAVCVRVEWAWLALPAGLCVLSIAVVGWTLVDGLRRRTGPLWKNSILSLMLQNQPGIGAMGLGYIEQMAKGLQITLQARREKSPFQISSNRK